MAFFRHEEVLLTMLTPAQVMEKLKEEVKPGTMMQFDVPWRKGDVREYRGELQGHSFRIIRRTSYRNSFTPVIEGRVTPIEGGSNIAMQLFVHPGVLIFLVVWTLMAAAATMMMVTGSLMLEDSQPAFGLIGLPFVGLIIGWIAFVSEVPAVRRYFKEMFPPWFDPALTANQARAPKSETPAS